jgi:hypothetical protein
MKRCAVLSFPLAMLLANVAAPAAEPAAANRLDEVEQRGREVMPFSLEQTVHVFTKTEQGGTQQVLAKDDAEAGQIRLIREHLRRISARFARGEFTDPATIHGDDMPGLAELRQSRPGQLDIVYRELPQGAQIDYTAREPELIAAIHRWFDAQLSDHARHAVPGHAPGHGGAR